MPSWYLILSAAVGLVVLLAVAYAELDARRSADRRPAFAGDADFDAAAADAPTRRESEVAFEWDEPAEVERTRTR